MKKIVISIIIMVVAVGVVYWVVTGNGSSDKGIETTLTGGEAMQEEDITMDDQEMMMQEDETKSRQEEDDDVMEAEEETATAPGVYIDYSAKALAQAHTEGKKPVLFFWAVWCPFCRAADSAFKNKLELLPENVVLLKTNYDTETELKKKYGVTYQHTFVQVAPNGDAITKWVSGDVDFLVQNIK